MSARDAGVSEAEVLAKSDLHSQKKHVLVRINLFWHRYSAITYADRIGCLEGGATYAKRPVKCEAWLEIRRSAGATIIIKTLFLTRRFNDLHVIVILAR